MIKLTQIHEQIRAAIQQSGLTQSQIAEKLNVKQPTISEYVTGKSFPALDTLANLCELLELDANEILCIKKRYI